MHRRFCEERVFFPKGGWGEEVSPFLLFDMVFEGCVELCRCCTV